MTLRTADAVRKPKQVAANPSLGFPPKQHSAWRMVMNSIRKIALSFTVATAVSLALAANANAGGVLGDIINSVAPGVGTALDRANAQLGNPVDHAAAAAANAYVPGAGTAMEAYWAAQRSGVLPQNPVGRPANVPPMGGAAPMPNMQPMGVPPMAVAMGSYCQTAFGLAGPGPMQPVGSPCHATTPFGRVDRGFVR
jgi:hypothetical protein